jgi:hypothetical protein
MAGKLAITKAPRIDRILIGNLLNRMMVMV